MKLKNIVVPAVFGFALSFFISILASHKFGTAFLRGFVFAFVFAALAVIIDFVYGKFLNDGVSIDIMPEVSKSDSRIGSKVDITINDAELSDDGDSLSFSVANNVTKLSDSDTKSMKKIREEAFGNINSVPKDKSEASVVNQKVKAMEQPSGAAESEKPAFKPVSLGSVPLADLDNEKVSSTEDSSKSASSSTTSENVSPAVSARRAERVAEKKEIDALPDLDSFGDEGDLDDDVIEDSEFAQDGIDSSDEGRIIFADGTKAKDHDTETLAKAIRTILKKDD